MSSKRAVFHQAVLEEDTLAGWISDAVKSTSPPWSDGSFEDRRSYSVGARRSQPRIMKRTTIVMMTDCATSMIRFRLQPSALTLFVKIVAKLRLRGLGGVREIITLFNDCVAPTFLLGPCLCPICPG